MTHAIPAVASAPWVAIQRNPTSGSGRQVRPLLDLVRRLRELGLRPRLYSDRGELDRAVVNPQHRETLRAIVAAGGDGTLLDLVNRHPEVPIAVLPLGTENLVARYLKVPRCGRAVAEMIAQGRTESFDAGQLGERRFLIMASAGFDAAVLHRTHAARRGSISRLSYVPSIFRELAGYPYSTLHVHVDDQPPVHGHLIVVGNMARYAMNFPMTPMADVHDGELDVRIFRGAGFCSLLRHLAAMLFEPAGVHPEILHLRGRRIRIESDEPVPVQIDGDPARMTPVEIEVAPASALLFVPADYRRSAR
jgi:diacylglycerol kinase (ATP)